MLLHSTNADVFAVTKDNQYAGICIVSVRDGKIRGTKTHLVKDAFKEKMMIYTKLLFFHFTQVIRFLRKFTLRVN